MDVQLARRLTPFGRELVKEVTWFRMMPDLAHSTPAARADVFALVDGRTPVVASHVGVRACYDVPYNLSDDEIREIARTGGVIGVISEPRFLQGRDPEPGLMPIWRTMSHIREVTGSWDYVAIGTDFDGGVVPPDALRDSSRLPSIAEMLRRQGVAEDEIARVMIGNVRRVLHLGWR